MRILITGATGFLGEHLTYRLLADGASVRILARSHAKAQPLVEQGAELIEGTVTDGDAVRRAVQGVSVVYHLAGKLFIPGVPEEEYRRTHVEGTRTLLAAVRGQSDLTRFVHCSTTGIFGTTGDLPADENARYAPTNAYERTKLEAELLAREAGREGLPVAVVRPGLVYGPGDLHLLGFFRTIERGLFRPIGRRPVWLHPIYIDDMTEAFVRCGTRPEAIGECFNIAGQEPVTLEALAAAIARALDVAPPRGRIPLPLARTVALAGDLLPPGLRQRAPLTRSRLDFLTNSRAYQVAKAQELLGFVASTDLATGMARTAAWYREHGYLSLARSA
jgi:nucleoside-diphosphate-sugar epimerase